MAVFAMIAVDCWKFYSKFSFYVNNEGKRINKETQKQFYGRLAAELIDKKKMLLLQEIEQMMLVLPVCQPLKGQDKRKPYIRCWTPNHTNKEEKKEQLWYHIHPLLARLLCSLSSKDNKCLFSLQCKTQQ
jgi:hypothetical protein